MLPFSSLSSNERALLMLLAYFYIDKLTEDMVNRHRWSV